METNIYSSAKIQQVSEEINFTSLLNSYCREFTNWSRYLGIPKYDPALAGYLETTGNLLHIRFDFSAFGAEVFAPLRYYSESGRHLFGFPVAGRNLHTDQIRSIDAVQFLDLAVQHAAMEFPGVSNEIVRSRLMNSVENLASYLEDYQQQGRSVNGEFMSFLDAEQSLLLGHNAHPVPKARTGFKDQQELSRYSPESSGKFQLAYFLLAPEHVTERNAQGFEITELFKMDLLEYAAADPEVSALLNSHPDWKVLPVHPWEAAYLVNQPAVIQMEMDQQLLNLGSWGPEFTPTSSVRTVYHQESEWMFKFSLHVKITNSERVNLLPELYRGYDISRLLMTDLGRKLRKDYPEIEFITDPAFYSVSYKGQIIEGFNTSVRHNAFRSEAADKNVTLLAALCQDGFLGQHSRMVSVITGAARLKGKSVEQTAVNWFKQYLHSCVGPLIGILNKYGMAFEFHQQNVLVELDSQLFPAKLYFRDNQGFFFRDAQTEALRSYLPDLGDHSGALAPDSFIIPKYTYYLLINNIMGVVNALGCNGLAEERTLIDLIYLEFAQFADTDTTGFAAYVLHSRSWSMKGNLLNTLAGIDEASATGLHLPVFRDYPNPLNKYFFCDQLIRPQTLEVVFSRYFPKEDITITLRPFNVETDLDMVHDWFNQEHAKPIWKMDGPIRDLEIFYRTLIPSDHAHSFIGEINGQPTFTIEPYWPMRDTVGAYYDALPSDYGSHLLIAPTDKDKKFSFPTGQVMLDWVFAHPVVGKCIGEAAVESRAMHIFGTRLGYRYQHVIHMPHKDATLTFCYREWYWEKFPDSQHLVPSVQLTDV